jgi:hypothetical protein
MSEQITAHCHYKTIILDSQNPGYVNRILVGTAATGLVRIEWHQARNGQIIPVNWSWVQMYHFLNSFIPLRYQVADAQNLIVKTALDGDYQWVLFYEHDVLPPPDGMLRLNEWMREEKAPVVSGLYFDRHIPSDPHIYRGRGVGAFHDFKLGEVVHCDGVPTGFLLVHHKLLRVMWDESPEYSVQTPGGPVPLRAVFNTPRDAWSDPETGFYNTLSGTSDLEWCTRIIEGKYMEKAGWGEWLAALPDPQYPFVVDTNIFCRHIDMNGVQYP